MLMYLGQNWIALLALVLSVTIGGTQLHSWWTNRRRTFVEAHLSRFRKDLIDAEAGPDEWVLLLVVVVRNVGGPTGVLDVGFELLGPGRNLPLKYSHGVGRDPSEQVSRVLADGEAGQWHVMIFDPSDAPDGTTFRVNVDLTDGRTLRTNAQPYPPDFPEAGTVVCTERLPDGSTVELLREEGGE